MRDDGSRYLPLETPHAENRRLRAENAELRQLLAAHGIPLPASLLATASSVGVTGARTEVPTEDQARQHIVLFRDFFRGRDDVYACRWENRDGRAGYVPATLDDWNSGRWKRAGERTDANIGEVKPTYLPLTDAVIEAHLLGKHTIGVYPLLLDETCWFLVADFDKGTWEEDTCAFLETCHAYGVPAALERSRSGHGGHLWIFFDRPVPAVTARQLGCFLLTRTMERRHQLGLDSYDRFFPNQDTLPKGGFGNLIALPLQFSPRKMGNSVFLDRMLQPYPTRTNGSILPPCHAYQRER